MPTASACVHSKNEALDSNRIIDCVSGMTRKDKGVGFGFQKSERFSTSGRSEQSVDFNSTGKSIPSTRPSSTRPSTTGSQVRQTGTASTKNVTLYGKDRQMQLVGAQELARSNPLSSQWAASMGPSSKPKPFTNEELQRRRTMPLKSSVQYPLGPVIVVDEQLAADEARGRPNTSSFCKGRRSTPANWSGGRKGVDSPGPIYVPNETSYRLLSKKVTGSPNKMSIVMMPRETTGLKLGTEQRFAPGLGSFETMSAPNVSPGSFIYRPDTADEMVMPRRATPATFKPRRGPGSMDYSILKSNTPSSKYEKVNGSALDQLSVYSTQPPVSFGRAPRDSPKTEDFVFMSAPPTSKMQRRMYTPHSPASTGMHSHNQYYSWT